MKLIELGGEAAKWGVADLYDEEYEKLRKAIESGEDFETDWYGCTKESNFAKVSREVGIIRIEVCASMDSLWDDTDLIYDALWEALTVDEELSDDAIDRIRDEAEKEDITDEVNVEGACEADASFDDVLDKLNDLEARAEEGIDMMYGKLCDIVKRVYEEEK